MKVIAKPIEVVAWFTKEGKPRPVRFRIIAEDQSEIVFKVEKILHIDTMKLAGNPMIAFTCQGAVNGADKLFEIRYEQLTCKWMLFKI